MGKPNLRVLVVEDDEAMRTLVCLWLEKLGYAPEGADSPGQALAKLSRKRFGLLFTDIAMPGSMDGIALAQIVKSDYPGTQILLSSGYGENLLVDHDLPGALLVKPYTQESLREAIGAVLPLTGASP